MNANARVLRHSTNFFQSKSDFQSNIQHVCELLTGFDFNFKVWGLKRRKKTSIFISIGNVDVVKHFPIRRSNECSLRRSASRQTRASPAKFEDHRSRLLFTHLPPRTDLRADECYCLFARADNSASHRVKHGILLISAYLCLWQVALPHPLSVFCNCQRVLRVEEQFLSGNWHVIKSRQSAVRRPRSSMKFVLYHPADKWA